MYLLWIKHLHVFNCLKEKYIKVWPNHKIRSKHKVVSIQEKRNLSQNTEWHLRPWNLRVGCAVRSALTLGFHFQVVDNDKVTFYLWVNYVSWNRISDIDSMKLKDYHVHVHEAVGNFHKKAKILEWMTQSLSCQVWVKGQECQKNKCYWFLNIGKSDNRVFRRKNIISNQEYRCCISHALSMEGLKVWCCLKSVIWAAMAEDILCELFRCAWRKLVPSP